MEKRTLHRPHNLNPIEGEGEWDVTCREAGDDE